MNSCSFNLVLCGPKQAAEADIFLNELGNEINASAKYISMQMFMCQ